MRFLGKSLLGLGLAALTLGFLAAAVAVMAAAFRDRAAESRPSAPAEEQVFVARLMTLTAGPVTPVITAYGQVQAPRSLALRAGQPGRIVWIAETMVEGGFVRAGEVLLRLDDAAAQTTLALARSDLDAARAEQAQAEAAVSLAADDLAAAEAQQALRAEALARQKDLQARGLGSPAAVETAALALSGQDQQVLSRRQSLANASARVVTAQTTVRRQELSLREAERALADLTVTAPFAGRLADVTPVLGGLVSANDSIGQLIDTARLDIEIRLSSDQFARLPEPEQNPTPFVILTENEGGNGADPRAGGQILRAAATVAEGETGRAVYGRITDGAGKGGSALVPGDFVTVEIREPGLTDAAVLPAAAVGADGTVLRVAADGRLSQQPVTVLRRQGNDVIIAAAGLAGVQIVAERSALLGAGVKVRLPQAETGAAPDGAPAEARAPLTPERRNRLIAEVTASRTLSPEDKARYVEALRKDQMPPDLMTRLGTNKGG